MYDMRDEIIDRVEDCRNYRLLDEIADMLDCSTRHIVDEIEDCRDDDLLYRILRMLRNEG